MEAGGGREALTATAASARGLDHLVLPVTGLAVARASLEALGFTVAPTGTHPFGTENCCVYLSDGTFLEPLAVRDPVLARRAAAAGNVFVGRDDAFRRTHKSQGLSAIVLSTDDAKADHHRLVGLGFSAGEMLTFSRPFTDSSGVTDEASFKLAFGAPPDSAVPFFFTCQRIGAPAVDRAALQRHDNGAIRIRDIVLAGDGGLCILEALRSFLGTGDDRSIRLGHTTLSVFDGERFAGQFGLQPDADDRSIAGVIFQVGSIDRLTALFSTRSVDYKRIGSRLVVQPQAGQGVTFAFEEIS